MRKRETQMTSTNSTISGTDATPILVIGGTGKTGRRIVGRLTDRNIPVRVGSRSAEIPFDWEDQSTWGPALQDVKSAYISYAPDIAIPGTVPKIEALVKLAAENGVRHLVLLSGRGEEEAELAEAVVQNSGLDWTIIRCSWFSQNFSENYLLEPILAGELVLPAGSTPEPYIDADDIADVAVAALTEAGHVGQLYELTGPRMLTFTEVARELSAAIGRPITYTEIPHEAYVAELKQYGLPDDVIWLIDYLFATVLDGRNAYLTDGVQRALGREPRDFAEYARDTAATGVWNV